MKRSTQSPTNHVQQQSPKGPDQLSNPYSPHRSNIPIREQDKEIQTNQTNFTYTYTTNCSYIRTIDAIKIYNITKLSGHRRQKDRTNRRTRRETKPGKIAI